MGEPHPGIVSTVTADACQQLCRIQLRQQFFCLCGVALSVVGHLLCPNIPGGGIDGQMDLVLGPAVFGTMLFDLPFASPQILRPVLSTG
ncbi:hypothetical protein A9J41_08975 [Laribacter hongkongensis]|nr:hypothetical protein [Laribacter hongkongensis]